MHYTLFYFSFSQVFCKIIDEKLCMLTLIVASISNCWLLLRGLSNGIGRVLRQYTRLLYVNYCFLFNIWCRHR